VVIGCF